MPTSQPRLPLRLPPYALEEEAALANNAFKDGLSPLNLRRALVHDPKLFVAFQAMAQTVLFKGSLPEREREIAIMRTGVLTRSEYEWGMHVSIYAERCGLTDQQVDDLTADDIRQELWTPRERLIVRMVDELHQYSTISDATWNELRSNWPHDEIVQLVMASGFYHMAAFFLNSMAVPLEEGARRFSGRLAQARVPVAGLAP